MINFYKFYKIRNNLFYASRYLFVIYSNPFVGKFSRPYVNGICDLESSTARVTLKIKTEIRYCIIVSNHLFCRIQFNFK